VPSSPPGVSHRATVAEFERAFTARVGDGHDVAVSCTTALHLALHLLRVGPGDEVVVPSIFFIATANATPHVGARLVFAGVDPVTGKPALRH